LLIKYIYLKYYDLDDYDGINKNKSIF